MRNQKNDCFIDEIEITEKHSETCRFDPHTRQGRFDLNCPRCLQLQERMEQRNGYYD